MNEIQYVYDAGGNKKSVIVPIELREKTLQLQSSRHEPCNPQDYYGVYRDLIDDPKGVAEAIRNEWDRVMATRWQLRLTFPAINTRYFVEP